MYYKSFIPEVQKNARIMIFSLYFLEPVTMEVECHPNGLKFVFEPSDILILQSLGHIET